jgi:hypothetical protein
MQGGRVHAPFMERRETEPRSFGGYLLPAALALTLRANDERSSSAVALSSGHCQITIILNPYIIYKKKN